MLKFILFLSTIIVYLGLANSQSPNELLIARQLGLSKHNYYRTLHGVGNLTLDQTINNVAQNYATNLARMGRMVHSGNQNYGENLYTSCVYMANLDIQNSIAAATDIWYNEISKYNYNYPGFSSETGHFTQVVWRTSNKVGFGVAVGTTGLLQCAYVVANYAPPGNYLGQFQQNVVPPLKYQL